MSWYAVESVDNAIDATRSFLFPFELTAWLKLALISLFIGVGGSSISSVTNFANIPASTPSEPAQQEPVAPPTEQIPEAVLSDPVVIAAAVGVVVLLLLISLGVAVASETLRLVFYDALRTGTVRLTGPASRRFGQALRLFGFKLLVTVGFGLPFVVIGAVVFLSGDLPDGTAVIGGLLAAVVIGLSAIAYLIVMRVTREFVVPVMVLTDSGVLDGWRRFWPVLRSQLAQFGVYVIVHFLLLLAISLGQSLLALIVFGIVGMVGMLVGLVVVLGVFGSFGAAVGSTAGVIALVAIALLTLLVVFVLNLPVTIVVLTYVTTYQVSVLGAADEDLQLLPDDRDVDTESTSTPAV